jgi:two-component system KDP operon response regulator KdpE
VTDGRLRILVVEDDPLNRTLARAVLARAPAPRIRDAQLTDAGSLSEARAALTAASVDLVLLDIHLPDGLGLDLARELRSRPAGDRPAVLALTASVLPAEQQATLDAGCDAFLAKPYAPEALIAAVGSLIGAITPNR